ncbi:MAG: hypothetical protein HQ541_22645, partial [Mariniphaga sp.]|nr:hypothetical protein [Mariniphaga sp.]
MFDKLKILVFTFIVSAGLILNSCTELTVENLNEPDLSKVFANTDEMKSYAGSAFRVLHNAMQEYDGPASSMNVMADQGTCPWGFAAVKDLSSEPRRGFVNSLKYAYYPLVQVYWEECYSSLSIVNDILRVVNENKTDPHGGSSDIKMLQAWGYFVSGVAHGYLGLTFDQGDIVLWDNKTDTVKLVPWQEMIDVSLELLDKSIALADENNFIIPMEWMGGEEYTSLELTELANSYAARILVYSSRNEEHNNLIDWNRVLNYAENGINRNLQPEMGDRFDFYNDYLTRAIYPGWVRIDHRIINLLDPDYPSRWPNDGVSWTTPNGQDPGPAQSLDARLELDFEYLQDNSFSPDRGYY